MKNFKFIRRFLLPLIFFIYIISIPFLFINMEIIIRFIDSVLKLKISPSFSGGKIVNIFYDDMWDDYGYGNLKYPNNPIFVEGTLDLLAYLVYEPQINSKWSDELNFWQLGLVFKNMSNTTGSIHDFPQAIINIYIDVDEGGSINTLYPLCEKVSFDPNHPWDFVINIDSYHKYGKLISYDKSIQKNVRIYSFKERKMILIRIPLDNSLTKKILDKRKTYHYVVVGGYSIYDFGNFISIDIEPNRKSGGGAYCKLIPKIFDMILPYNLNQKEVLSGYNEVSNIYARIYPIEVDLNSNNFINNNEYIKKIEKIIELTNKEKIEEIKNKLKDIQNNEYDKVDLGIIYFKLNEYEKSEKIFSDLLNNGETNSLILAYYGVLNAIKGGKQKSATKAIEYVNKGFELINKAINICQNDIEIIHSRMCRANVALSIPEMVFQKSKIGAYDFIVALDLWKNLGISDIEKIELLIKAGHCFLRANMYIEAQICYYNAIKLFKEL